MIDKTIFKHHSSSYALVFVGLLLVVAPCWSETEPNNTIPTANTVTVNASENTPGGLSSDEPIDVLDCFKFTLPGDGILLIGVTPTANLDMSLTLLDTDGVSVLSTVNAAGKGGVESIRYENLRAGTYYLVVSLASGTGTYGASFSFQATSKNDTEPNDIPTQAGTLASTGSVVGHIGYRGTLVTDASDMFKVALASDGALELTINPDGNLNVGLQLFDSNGSFVLSTKNDTAKGGTEKITYGNLTAATYYAKVYLTEGYGSYTLNSAFTTNADPNDTEPNDSYATAATLALTGSGSTSTGTAKGHLGYYGNLYSDYRDHWKVTLPAYGKLTLASTAGAGNNVDVGYEIFNANGRKIAGAGTDSYSVNGMPAGLYYFRVYAENRYGAYSIAATFESQEAPQPFAQQTSTMQPNGQVSSLTFNTDNRTRYYKVTIPSEGAFTIETTTTNGVRVFTRLYDQYGTAQMGAIDNYYTAEPRSFTISNIRAGDYIVSAEWGGGEGSAGIKSTFVPATRFDTEPNDDWASVTPVSLTDAGLTFSGNIGYAGNGWTDPADNFVLDVAEDGAVTIVSTAENTVRFGIHLYDNYGAIRDYSSADSYYTTNPQTIGKVNLLAGRYFIHLDHRGGYGSYDIQVTLTPNRSGDTEPNDNDFQALSLALGDGTTGHLGYEKGFRVDPADWYKIVMPNDGMLQVFAHATSDSLRYLLELYHSDRSSRISAYDAYYTPNEVSIGYTNLRAGTYYIRVLHYGGQGTYQFRTVFTEQVKRDTEPNNLTTMPVDLALNTIVQGSLAYNNHVTSDSVDWYRVQVTQAGQYRMSVQIDPSLRLYSELFQTSYLTRLRADDLYYNSNLVTRDFDLQPGTYLIALSHSGGYGTYTLRFGSVSDTAVGSLSGKVIASAGFPLGEVSISILERSMTTSYTGVYSFANVAPGMYTVRYSAGSKYYPVEKQITIQPGVNTFQDVTMQETNATAPQDVAYLYGFARDRFLHLFWSPSVSPDVADGGGYKLYITGKDPIDLGNVLNYRSVGFQNGVTYTCRLTVYDKFGNESFGRVVILTPPGTTPAVTPTPTSTPTPPSGPTPTPTNTPVPPAEREPNNNLLSDAEAVQVNSSRKGNLAVSGASRDSFDVFKIEVPADGFLQVRVAPSESLDISVQLIDTDRMSVLDSKNDGGNGVSEGILYRNLLAGTYYAVVKLIGGSGDYHVDFNFTAVQEIDVEPNDAPGTAAPLQATGNVRGHIGYHGWTYTDLADYYVVSLPADGQLETTVYPDGSLNLGLQLIDSDGNFVLINKNDSGMGASEKNTHANLKAGVYFVLVYQTEGYGSYTLTSLFKPNTVTIDAEPNDAAVNAISLSLVASGGNKRVGTATGHLGYYGNLSTDQRDHYRVEIPSYGKISLSAVKSGGNNVSVGYEFFNASGRKIAGTGSEELTVEGLDPGIYYFRIYQNDRYGGYTVTCVFEPQEAPLPFSQPVTALEVNTSVTNVTINADNPTKYYQLNVPADGYLTVQMTGTSAFRVYTRLYDRYGISQMGSIDNYYNNNTQSFDIKNIRAGNYIVATVHGGGEGTYTLATVFTPATYVDTEPNDDWASVTPVTLTDAGRTFVGNIGYGGNGWTDGVENYVLDIPEDGAISIVSTAEATVRYGLHLYDSYGAIRNLTNIDSYYTANPQSIGKVNMNAGRYFIHMDHRGGYGSYELKVTFIPNRSSDPELDDNDFQAVAIQPGEGRIGYLGYDKGYRTDPADWYKVVLPKDGVFQVFAHADSNTLRYLLELYQSDKRSRITSYDAYYTPNEVSIGNANLRAGTYYIRMLHYGGQGTYQFYTVFTEQRKIDDEPNNIASMALELPLNTIRNGSLNYTTNFTGDSEDWYFVTVSAAGQFKLNYQSDHTLRTLVEFYDTNGVSRIFGDDRYYTSDLYSRNVDLNAGTYYVRLLHYGGYGSYSVRFGDPAGSAAGTVAGKVTTDTNFPLSDVSISVLNRTVKSDGLGNYSIENLAPGTYTLQFSSGALYYAVNQQVEIRAGETTTLNVKLYESNVTAPADVAYYYGFARDRYIHLFWSPTVSPDVADGGKYKLYINNQEAIDIGIDLEYRQDGFQNGVAYTCRLTVVDKYGNESTGKTLVLTPTGAGAAPTPTPTQVVVPPTNTPTRVPSTVTPTPTVPVSTPTSTVPSTATPTPTIPGGTGATATPTRVAFAPTYVFDFNENSISDAGFLDVPGGFEQVPEQGSLIVANILPTDNAFPGATDGRGIVISVDAKERYAILGLPIDVQGKSVLMRASVRTNGGSSIVQLGALSSEGQVLNNSLSLQQAGSSQSFANVWKRFGVWLDPPAPNTHIWPLFQVVNVEGGASTTVYIDRIELYILEPGQTISSEFFGVDGTNP